MAQKYSSQPITIKDSVVEKRTVEQSVITIPLDTLTALLSHYRKVDKKTYAVELSNLIINSSHEDYNVEELETIITNHIKINKLIREIAL